MCKARKEGNKEDIVGGLAQVEQAREQDKPREREKGESGREREREREIDR